MQAIGYNSLIRSINHKGRNCGDVHSACPAYKATSLPRNDSYVDLNNLSLEFLIKMRNSKKVETKYREAVISV